MGNDLFQNKYRIKSIRLEHWDYSSDGAYFVTICVKDRECVLGEIVNGKIKLSKIGDIVKQCWCEIPKHFKNVDSDEFIVMPNHVHGIIQITNDGCDDGCRDAINRVSTGTGGITHKYNPMLSKSLSTIIRWYKGRCKYEINKNQNKIYFQWQPRFYESIIRNENHLNAVREYIVNNPSRWEFDRNNNPLYHSHL
ncbi:MAG: transposase [Candidatus Melainabacteria bacterium]|nr:transposase [Candidatus Melainabacteria bacterium]